MQEQESAPVEVEAPEPVPQVEDHGEMSFEDTMRLIASQAGAVDAPPDEESESQGVDDEAEVPEVPEDALAAPDTATEGPDATPEPEPQVDRSLARIMEREAALQTKQDAYDNVQEELNGLRSRLDTFESTQSTFSADPVSFIKSLAPDLDLKRLAEGLWNEQLGEKAPADYLQKKAATRQLSERDVRLAKLEQAETERQHRQEQEEANRGLNQYIGSLQTFAASAPSETLPLVALMQEKNPQLVAQSMENIARGHAQQSNGQVLTPEQVGAELEKQLGLYQLRAEPAKAAAPPPAQSASLRNSSTQVQPDRAVEDELSDEYLHEQAMEAVRKTAR